MFKEVHASDFEPTTLVGVVTDKPQAFNDLTANLLSPIKVAVSGVFTTSSLLNPLGGNTKGGISGSLLVTTLTMALTNKD